jgi:hypothetical protein
MKPRRKQLTIRRIQKNSEILTVTENVKDAEMLALEEKESIKIRKALKKKGIFFAHNTGLKKLREKLEATEKAKKVK